MALALKQNPEAHRMLIQQSGNRIFITRVLSSLNYTVLQKSILPSK